MTRSRLAAFVAVLALSAGCSDDGPSPWQTFYDTSAPDAADTPAPDVGSPSDVGADATGGDTAAPLANQVTIATFNVGRLFDTVCDTGSCESGFESVLSETQFRFRTGQIAQALDALEADVALLQEVETLEALEAVAAAAFPPFDVVVIGETGAPASLDVAVLARGARLVSVEEHGDLPLERPGGGRTSFARELLEVQLDVNDERLIVFTAHFKSKSNDDPGRRFAEAVASRDVVLEAASDSPDAIVVFGGDMNDTPDSDPLIAFEEEGGLLRVAAVLGDDDGTHEYAGEVNAIDHLYLATDAAGAVVSGSVEVRRDASGGFGGSDHAALRATFGRAP